MHHVVYRSDGVARAALGAAKKIDLTAPKSGRGPLAIKEADLGRMTDSWSQACGTSCEPESRGVSCQPALVRGARFPPGSDAGALRACGRGCLMPSPAGRLGRCDVSTAPTSRFTETPRTRSAARPIKPWGAPRAVSTRSWRPWWMGSGEQSVCISLRGSSTTFGPAHRFILTWKENGRLRTALSIRTASAALSPAPAHSTASLPAADGARRSASTANFTGTAMWLKTSSAGSSVTAVSRPATRNSRSPFTASFALPPCSTGSTTRSEPALKHRPAFHFPAAENEAGDRKLQRLAPIPRIVRGAPQFHDSPQREPRVLHTHFHPLSQRQSPGSRDFLSQLRHHRRGWIVAHVQSQIGLMLGHSGVPDRISSFS